MPSAFDSVSPSVQSALDEKADENNLISDTYATLSGTKYGALNGVAETISIASVNSTNSGIHNQAIGALAGRNLTSGKDNLLYGRNAGRELTTGDYNVFVGAMAGRASLDADSSVMIGKNAGEKIQTGSSNLILGKNASINIQSGAAFTDASDCVYLGAEIEPLTSGAEHEVVIGAKAKGHGSKSVTIGNSDKNEKTILTGSVGIGTSDPSEKLHIEGSIKASGDIEAAGASFGSEVNLDELILGSIVNGSQGQIRLVKGGYGAIFRQDGSNLYILITNSGDEFGNWNGLRPFRIDLATGTVVIANTLYSAQNGNVGVGTSAPSEKLEVAGNIKASGTINGSSDARLKSNIRDMTDAERRAVLSIKTKVYNRSDLADGQLHAGVIAQKIIAAFEAEGLDAHDYALISGEGTEAHPYGVAYSQLSAMREQAIIDKLQEV